MELWSIHKFATESGMAHRTIETRLNQLGLKPSGHGKTKDKDPLYSIRDFLRAYLGGDIEAERLRKTREEADKLALENDKTRGRLVEVDAMVKIGEKVFVGTRQAILASSLLDTEKDALLLNLQSIIRDLAK